MMSTMIANTFTNYILLQQSDVGDMAKNCHVVNWVVCNLFYQLKSEADMQELELLGQASGNTALLDAPLASETYTGVCVVAFSNSFCFTSKVDLNPTHSYSAQAWLAWLKNMQEEHQWKISLM